MHRASPFRGRTLLVPAVLLLAGALPAAGASLSLTWSPASPQVAESVLFTFSPIITGGSDYLDFTFGDGQSAHVTFDQCPTKFINGGVCKAVAHTYSSEGVKSVSVSGQISGVPYTAAVQVTVSGGCTATLPAAGFTFAPAQPTIGQAVTFTDTSANQPTAWAWTFGDGGTSTQQNPSHTYQTGGTYTVRLTATNCKGSNSTQKTVTVAAACSETDPPAAAFSWSPQGVLDFHGVEQQQPFAGQPVTFTDQSSNNPTAWLWSGFGEDGVTYTTAGPTHTFAAAGEFPVTLEASNCAGTSTALTQTVTVYPDVRPVLASFTFSAQASGDATVVTFTAATGFDQGSPTAFSWSFGDGSSGSGATVQHTYTCRGSYTVTLTARRGDTASEPFSRSVTVEGESCGPDAIIVTGAASLPGLNDTSWRTDMWIFNPAAQNALVSLALLPADTDNGTPLQIGPLPLAAHATLVVNDVLDLFSPLLPPDQELSKAAVRVTWDGTDQTTPVVLARTFTDVAGGGSYGQFVPGVPVGATATPRRLWLTGLHNDGTEEGFRTNIGVNNLHGDASLGGATATLLDAAGAPLASLGFGLPPYGYVQKSLGALFGSDYAAMGGFGLRIDLPAGGDLLAYASEVENHTGDPVLLVAAAPPDSTVWLPGVAHNPGLEGTVWRSDLQITNVDGAEHTFEVRLYPAGKPMSLFRNLTLAAGATADLQDVVAWVYGDMTTPDVSGMVRVASGDGTGVMPMVRARTYNLTPEGEFGQNIPALTGADGASAAGPDRHLLLAGMSSEDIARSNLGFANLGIGTATFAVTLYGPDGTVLNPGGAPLTVSVGAGGWSQRKLEDRFREAFGTGLGANLEGISAIVQVTAGGPGVAYASVVDNITGDPIYIPAQAAP